MSVFTEKELYQKILERIEISAETKNENVVQFAISIGVARSTYFGIKRYLKETNHRKVLSNDSLIELAEKVGFKVNSFKFEITDLGNVLIEE